MTVGVWIRALVPGLGTGWTTTVADGRQVVVVEQETTFGLRWMVYARPYDSEQWGKPYELNGIGSLTLAQSYVEAGFQFPARRSA